MRTQHDANKPEFYLFYLQQTEATRGALIILIELAKDLFNGLPDGKFKEEMRPRLEKQTKLPKASYPCGIEDDTY